MSRLQGKVAVITGASAGIGAAIARDLAAQGTRLVLTARREDRLKSLAAELGSETAILAADMSETSTPQRLLDLASKQFGGADFLVNNAGVFRSGTVDGFDLYDLGPLIALNFEAVVRASYVFARHMKLRGMGSIVNISSIGATLNAQGSGVYGGLKRAMEIFSDSLRIELAGSGVRIGTVAPGSTATEIFDHLPVKPGSGLIPLEPEDVAHAVRYLLDQPERANVPHLRIYASGQQH
jgi:NADP-dependent 3-hydroxy acid dehydrogenase YdfG